MAEKSKPSTPDTPESVNAISVHLSVSPDSLSAALSAFQSLRGTSSGISVRGGTVEIEKAIKTIESAGLEPISAFLRVVGKEPKLS